MNYQQSIDFLFSRLPMFQRIGAPAYKANLDNTIHLCSNLGNPEKQFKSIHIAGTNGKGSVSHLVASVLQTAGYKTGLFTSPHLKDFRERIRVNGKKIPKSFVIDFVNQKKELFSEIQPSFFEYTFGMAVHFFAKEQVNIAVIETGMGGRLDSTNVVQSIVSVITNIGLDHTQFLGDSVEKIASEKAGIIKYRVPVVLGQTQKNVYSVFQKAAKENESVLFVADENFTISKADKLPNTYNNRWKLDIQYAQKSYLKNLQCPLSGNYQIKNILTSLQVIEVLKSLGYSITEHQIKEGIKNVIRNTGFQGRWQVLGRNPAIICDTGHNEDGLTQVILQLNEFKYDRLHFVAGFVNDKNIDGMLSLLPKKAIYYFCRANIPRGLDSDELLHKAQSFGLSGKSYGSVQTAYCSAKNEAGKNDLIFIGGSTFVVAEVI